MFKDTFAETMVRGLALLVLSASFADEEREILRHRGLWPTRQRTPTEVNEAESFARHRGLPWGCAEPPGVSWDDCPQVHERYGVVEADPSVMVIRRPRVPGGTAELWARTEIDRLRAKWGRANWGSE